MYERANKTVRDEGALEKADSMAALGIVLADLATQYGFDDYTIYDGLADALNKTQPMIILSSLPQGFHAGIDSINDECGDDYLERTWSEARPQYWDMSVVYGKPDPRLAKALSAHFLRYGVTSGVNVPVNSRTGRLRVVSMTGTRGPMPPEELESLHYLSIMVVNRFEEIEADYLGDGVHELSAREREFLQAVANGEEADTIARDAELSLSTVSYILESARRKLGCASLMHAVAEAYRRGLIA